MKTNTLMNKQSFVHNFSRIMMLNFLAVITIFSACNSSGSNKENIPDADTAKPANIDTIGKSTAAQPVTTKAIVLDYLEMKNALSKDNDKDAANAGDAMIKSVTAFNKSALTPEQAKIYADIEDDVKEHAEHIGKNAGNIKHQREHFDMLSKDIYKLVKTFGSDEKLYYDHCPMYYNGKGADWLSETKEIVNPYFGKAMSTCGMVKEEIK